MGMCDAQGGSMPPHPKLQINLLRTQLRSVDVSARRSSGLSPGAPMYRNVHRAETGVGNELPTGVGNKLQHPPRAEVRVRHAMNSSNEVDHNNYTRLEGKNYQRGNTQEDSLLQDEFREIRLRKRKPTTTRTSPVR